MFVLPRNHSPLTLVVLAVDPPVRKGQTHYSHVLAQFPTDEDVTVSLQLSPEQMAEKNENTVRGGRGSVKRSPMRGISSARLVSTHLGDWPQDTCVDARAGIPRNLSASPGSGYSL